MGRFAADRIELHREPQHGLAALRARLWLQPFDQGISQRFELCARPSDIEEVCDRVIIINRGAIVYDGNIRDLSLGNDLKKQVRVIFSAARDAMILLASRLTSVEYFRGAQRAGMASGVIYAPEEAFEDEHFVARGFQQELEHEDLGRSFRYPGAPYRFEKSPWSLQRRAPHLGEHNDEVYLKDLGMSTDEVLALKERRVI